MDDVDRRISHHLRRTGADQHRHDDPLTSATTNILRDVLTLVSAALDDEHIPDDVQARILDRVIYGATPMPSHVQQRQLLEQRLIEQRLIEHASRTPAPTMWPIA